MLHYLVFKVQLLNMFCQSLLTGGDEENRTPDPLLARQVLSQLSYTPMYLGVLSLPFQGYVIQMLEYRFFRKTCCLIGSKFV